MLDDILELILDIVIDGVFEGFSDVVDSAVNSRKVPMPVRILLAAIILIVFIGIFALLLYAGLANESPLLVAIAAVFFVLIAVFAVRKIRKFMDE